MRTDMLVDTLFADCYPATLHRFTQKSPLSQSIPFSTTETLKITLTAQEKGKGKRPHQAFLVLRETTTGVEAPFPLTVKDNGKATLEIVRPLAPLQNKTKNCQSYKTVQEGPRDESQLILALITETDRPTNPTPELPGAPLRFARARLLRILRGLQRCRLRCGG